MDIVRRIARILIATWLGIFLGAEVFLWGIGALFHPGLIAMYLLLFLIADELQARWSLSQRHIFVLGMILEIWFGALISQELYQLAKPLMKPVQFTNQLDWVWYEIWHHEGRRARHGVSMMGPDYTHWHGTYEVAKHFYTEMIPELEALARQGRQSAAPDKVAASQALEKKMQEVLNSANHRWFLNKMDPKEQEDRQRRQEEFKKRYGQ